MENNMNAFEMNEESLENVIGGAAKPTKSAGKGYKWYQIKHGDTLIKIAKKHGTTYTELQKINKIKNPDFIVSGTWIKVPA